MEPDKQALIGENNLPELVQDKNGNIKALKSLNELSKVKENLSLAIEHSKPAVEELGRALLKLKR